MYGIDDVASLEILIQCGLSALKTPHCYDDDKYNVECPVCSPYGRKIAEALPNAHHSTSRLICPLSKRIMNENNPPIVSPDGEVYSLTAVKESIKNNHEDVFLCGKTGKKYELEEFESVYII